MKKKFFVERTAFLFMTCVTILFIAFQTVVFCVYDINDKINEIATLLALSFIMFVCPILFMCVGGTVLLEKNELILKKTVFHKKQYFSYKDIKKISLEFYNHPSLYRTSIGPLVLVYFSGCKNASVVADMQYKLVQKLLDKKPLHSQIKIEFYSLRIFSEKYRELLYEYLTAKQKKELERLLEKKNRRKRKKTA